jgi:glycosyltransferase involved in cell wall biosynthesis
MGAIYFSIDSGLVDLFARHLPFEVFVETGTYKGESIDRIKPYFNRFYSIELSEYYVELARTKFKDDPTVTLLHGDAGEKLKNLRQELAARSVLFWLDSHWCDDSGTAGAASQCSLMNELRSIGELNSNSVILIDDARLFLCPPGKPHDYLKWPDLNEVLSGLQSLSSSHECMVINDIIVYFPQKVKAHVRQYGHEHGADWLHAMDVFRQYDQLISDLKAKEVEIACIGRENAVLTKEIHIKQQEITNITEIAHQRQYVINQFEHQFAKERETAACFFEGQIQHLIAAIEEKKTHVALLNESILEKDREIERLKDAAESRLKVIQDLDGAIRAYQKRRIRERIRLWLQPRIGVLYHYPPRPMKVPRRYMKYKDKPVEAEVLPVISIVTPAFNHAAFIERTLISVLEQDYPKLQYMIQDGGSDDGTVDILKKYDGRLFRWDSRKDNGQAEAINLGLKESTGDIMSYLNSDDLLLPGALQYVARYFLDHPEADVVYGHRVMIDEYDQEIGRWVLPPHDDAVLSWADFIPQETMFWRRRIWEKAGGYINEEFKFAMDWDLILRFREAGAKFIRVPRFLGAFRVHPHQKTSKEIADQGDKEMNRLRERTLGRSVSEAEINLNLKKYMKRHILHHKLYRAGLLRY